MALIVLSALWPLLLAAFLLLWLGYVVVSRRYFHPLSKVPGPFLWSVSGLPILYHQAIREGKLMHVLPKLHNIYGPVVRIAPNEVHLSDPENYEKIYNIGTKFFKDPDFYKPMEGPVKIPVILTIISNEAHRVRRARLNPFFSRRSVIDLENIVSSKARKLCGIIQSALDSPVSEPFDAHHAVRGLATDVITEYAYARCWNQLDDDDFGAWYQEAIRAVQAMFVWFQTFPFLIPIFGLIPDWFNVIIFPPFKKWNESLQVVQSAVKEVRKEIALGVKPARRTIFHDLIEPAVEKRAKQQESLSDLIVFADAVNLTGAGEETTGATVERAIFEVISNPIIYRTVTRELREAFPDLDAMNWTSLETLPYLTGIIKEALRINPGVPGHLPRVVPTGGATFNGFTLPRGTVASMSAWLMHQNVDAFPEPETFNPRRWIGPPDEVRARERCLVPFGRGSRNCVGQNLAMCQMYYTLGTIFYCFDNLQVYHDFGREDLEMVELLIGYHPRKAKKFKIVKKRSVVSGA